MGRVGDGVGAACSLALILALVVLVGLWLLAGWIERDRIRAQRKADVERHIDKLYNEILTKAAAAAAADYAGLPQPLFNLLTTLREKLGPLIDLGGPMRTMVDRISEALNHRSTCASPEHPIPAQGETILIMPNPPTYTYQTVSEEHLSANSELQQAAHAFSTFWGDRPRVTGLIRDSLKKLGGDDLF